MRKIFLLSIIITGTCNLQSVYAQLKRCATYTVRAKEDQLHPGYAVKRASFENAYESWIKTQAALKKKDSIFIPVVVHVIWHNAEENIVDRQVQSQIDVLNADFNSLNADTINTPSYFKERHGKTNFYFRLAKQTPDGLPTNGISRRYTTVDSGFGIDDQVQYTAAGGEDPWDPAHYVNIWICKFSINTFAYTYFPGGSLRKEGIVCDYHYFGTKGTVKPPYNLGRTISHEMGHYFNLDHTWGPTDITYAADCTDDDHVYDTPLQSVANYVCPGFPNISCIPDTSDAYMDYMDYTDDACMNLFTKGQVERMVASYYIMTPELHNSKALQEPLRTRNDAGIKEILSPVNNSYTCAGSIRPVIVLRNYGNEILDSVLVLYSIRGSGPATYKFTGISLQPYSLDTLKLPAIDVTGNGKLVFTAYTQNPNGKKDENFDNDKASIVFNYNVSAVAKLPFSEDFSHGSFPPKGWSVVNSDGYFTWAPTTSSLLSGYSPSIMMDNIEYPNKNETDDLVMPPFNFAGINKPGLIFDYAFALYKYGRNKSDTLKIKISADCGTSWQTVYYKGGLDLSTAANGKYAYFSPDSLSQWKRDTLDLTAFAGYDNILIAFENINGNDNLLYLDNIAVKNLQALTIAQTEADNIKTLKEIHIAVVPNPVTNSFSVSGVESAQICSLKLFDVAGRCVWQAKATLNAQVSFVLPGSITNGTYLLSIQQQNKTSIKKIFVSR